MRTSVSVEQPAQRAATSELLRRIGRTPLVPLPRLEREFAGVRLFAKAEWHNPGGSVKDRAAASIIAEAEADGRLRDGVALLDATSGNTGVAYAMIAAAKGYRATLCVPKNANPHVLARLRGYGAEVVLTDPLQGSDGAIREARRLAAEFPSQFVYLDQYNNPANWKAHYRTTAVEIWDETNGSVTHFIAGLGTTGTLTGTGRRLKELNPRIRAVAVQPDAPFHGLEGLKHLESAIVPGIYDPSVPDETLFISTEAAYEAVQRLLREEDLFVGPSAGAALAAGLQVARRLSSTAREQPGTIPPPVCPADHRLRRDPANDGGRRGSTGEIVSHHTVCLPDPLLKTGAGGGRQTETGGGTIVMIFPDAGGRYATEALSK